jgi:hypothetical protein
MSSTRRNGNADAASVDYVRVNRDGIRKLASLESDDAVRESLALQCESDMLCIGVVSRDWQKVAENESNNPLLREFAAQHLDVLARCGEFVVWDEEEQASAEQELTANREAQARGEKPTPTPVLNRMVDSIGASKPMRTMGIVSASRSTRFGNRQTGRRSSSSRRTRSGASSGSSDDGEPSSGLEPPPAVIYAAAAAFATRASFDRTAPAVSAWLQAWGDERAGGLA